MATVIEHSINSLLKHPFLVPDNYVGSFQLHKTAQPIIPVYDTSVKIVQIRCSKTPAFEWHERPQLRRYHGHNSKNHVFRTCSACPEAFADLHPAHDFLAGLLGPCFTKLFLKCIHELIKIDALESFANTFRTH